MYLVENFPGTTLNANVWDTVIKDSNITISNNRCTIGGSGWYGGAIRTKGTVSLLNTTSIEFDYSYTGSLHQNGAGAYEYVALTGPGLTRETSYYYGLATKGIVLYLDTSTIYVQCLDTNTKLGTYSITTTSIHIKMVYTPATKNLSVYVNNSVSANLSVTIPDAELTALGSSVNVEFYYGNYQAGTYNSGTYSNIKVSDNLTGLTDLTSKASILQGKMLPSSGIVRLTKTEDLQSKNIISPYTSKDLDGSINVRGGLDIYSSAVLQHNIDLVSNAIVQFISTLDIKYLISCMEEYRDLESKGAISWVADLVSSTMVRTWGSMDLNSIVHSAKFNDLISSVYKPYAEDLLGKTTITDLNIMDIIFKVVQAPINVLTCPGIQDSYIREARPTINYGTAESLLTGNAVEGQYQSLMQINTAGYNNLVNNPDMRVISGELVLRIVGNYDSSMIIDVIEVTTTWNESTVTWANFSQNDIKVITSFSCTSTSVRVDLTDYLKARKQAGYTNVNLLLRARNTITGQLIYFESLNSTDTTNRPHLEIRYQDNTWSGYVANTDLNGSVTIRAMNSKDLMSNTLVRLKDTRDIPSNGIIKRTGNLDLATSTTIRRSDDSVLPSLAQLLPNKDLDASVIVRRSEFRDLLNSANLYNKLDIESFTDVKSFNAWLNGQAIIRGYSTSDLSSTVVIRHNIDLPSNATSRLTKLIDLSGKAIIKKYGDLDLTSNATLRQYADMLSKAILQKTVTIDLSSKVAVRYSTETDLSSTIQVRGSFDDLTSTVMKRVTTGTSLNSMGYSAFGLTLDSTATVKSSLKTGDIDLSSSARIRRTLTNDLNSVATVHHVIDLLSTSIVRKLATNDLLSTIKIRQIADLISSATIKQIKDLSSKGTVRLTKQIDLLSNAIIRQYDVTELDSTAYMFGMEVCNLDGSVMVQRMGKDYLDSKVTIQTTARQWIPNVHGVEVFNYEDRKLPRVWKRENFIP